MGGVRPVPGGARHARPGPAARSARDARPGGRRYPWNVVVASSAARPVLRRFTGALPSA